MVLRIPCHEMLRGVSVHDVGPYAIPLRSFKKHPSKFQAQGTCVLIWDGGGIRLLASLLDSYPDQSFTACNQVIFLCGKSSQCRLPFDSYFVKFFYLITKI